MLLFPLKIMTSPTALSKTLSYLVIKYFCQSLLEVVLSALGLLLCGDRNVCYN